MTVIVVPVDGSTRSESALRPGASLAAAFGGELIVLGALDGSGGLDTDRLDDIVSTISEVVPTRVVVTEGDPHEVILANARQHRPSLICMATHGRGALVRAVMGSVADAVVSESDVPIVLVGDECRTVPLVGERMRVVVCHDGSDAADAVVPVAATFMRLTGATVRLVEVVAPDENVPDQTSVDARPLPSAEVVAATARLGTVRDRLLHDSARVDARSPVGVDVEVLHGADVARAVHHFADRIGASLVAAATHGCTGVRRLATGSVALEIVRRSRVPVVLVRSDLEGPPAVSGSEAPGTTRR